MVNKEMKFLDNGDIRYEVVDEAARSNIQTINTVLDTKADTSNVTVLDTRVTGVEDDCYNSYAVGTASGAIASFTDGADDLPIKSLMVDINPVQDLHGYDSPWVGGSGKNKWEGNESFSGSTADFIIGTSGALSGAYTINLPQGEYIISYKSSVGGTQNIRLFKADGTYFTSLTSTMVSGLNQYTINCTEDIVGIAVYINANDFSITEFMIRLSSATDPTYAPYENICPISGWTGVQVIRTGKNLLPNLKFQNAPSTVGIGQTEYVSSNQKIYLSAGTYTLSTVTTASGRCFYKKKGGTNTAIGSSSQVNPNGTFTITETGFYAFWIYNGNGFSADDLISFQLEKSTTATEYEPYNGTIFPISWESETGTVYGGKLDVLTGELTVDKAMVDLRTLNWTYTSDTDFGYNFFTCSSFTNRKRGSVYLICDRYATASGGRNTMTSDAMISSYNATNSQSICIRDDRYTTVSDFIASLDGAQLVYELATPTTIQLTPHEVKSLLGQNNIFADTGDIDIEYKADTTLYIERLIESNVDKAEEAKIDAQNSATQAGQSASQALTYKTDTESARDEAQSIVDSISANASQIDTNTESIASLEEDRYKPYVTDSASGAIASFTDGADDLPLKSLVVNIDPVQDLHGYDSPWVAGGGKNKAIPLTTTATIHSVAITCSSESETITLTGTATDNGGRGVHLTPNITLPVGTYILSITGTHVGNFSVSKSDDSVFISNENYSFTLSEETTVYIGANVINGTTYNETVKVQLESGTTATQWTPYENICPINGWEEMTVSRTGVNLFGGLPLAQSIYNTAYETTAKIDTENHTVEFTRGAQHEDGSYRGIIFDKFKSGKQYTFIFSASQNTAGTNNSIRIVYSDGSTYAVGIKGTDKTIYRYTTPVGKSVAYIALDYFGSTLTTLYCDECGIFEGVVSVDDFEPYNGTTIPIDWQSEAGTVYGGHLDVLTGMLTVDRAMVDLGTLTWTYRNTGYNTKPFLAPLENALLPNISPIIVPALCSRYPQVPPNQMNTAGRDLVYAIGFYFDGRKELQILDSNYTDAQTFKTAMDGVQLVYKLAEPITIQLTPHQVNSLLGQNNIFANTGDSSVEYRADTKLYIERLTAPDSADMIADSNIVSGQYFMVSNALYKATANIANGGQIIVGTNCIKVSLATALNEINA